VSAETRLLALFAGPNCFGLTGLAGERASQHRGMPTACIAAVYVALLLATVPQAQHAHNRSRKEPSRPSMEPSGHSRPSREPSGQLQLALVCMVFTSSLQERC